MKKNINYFWLWSTQIMVNYLIMSSLVERFVNYKLVNFSIKLFVGWNTYIKWGFAIGLNFSLLNNIILRNLRPENLVLDENNNLKITDFANSNTYKPGTLLKTA